MENQLHIRANKKDKLIELLLKTQDKRRYHNLYLTSCYFTPESAKEIIAKVSETIRLSCVTIYMDRKTAVLHGAKVLAKFCKNSPVDTEVFAVESETLFHSKAYALVAYEGTDQIYCGSLVVGSANLTGAGLTKRGGNIECLLGTQKNEVIDEFLSQLKELKAISLEDIDKFRLGARDSYTFKYALLQRGKFIHKWTGDLGQYFAVRFRLNKAGKDMIGDPIFKSRGFDVETATISKRYFEFEYEPPHLEDTEMLTKNYGIETFLGWWVPNTALLTLQRKQDVETFKSELFRTIDAQLAEIKERINEDSEYLEASNIVEKDESNSIVKFQKKIDALREDESRLMRIFTKFEVFDLPYDPQDKSEIEGLFDDILELCESRKRKNSAMKGFLNAYEGADLDLLDLDS